MSPFMYGYYTLPIYCRTKRALSDWFCGFSLACKTPYYGPPLLGPAPSDWLSDVSPPSLTEEQEAEHASYISQFDDGPPVLVDLSGEDRDTLPSCPSWPFPETYSSPPPPPLLKVTLVYCFLILLSAWALAHAWYGP